MRWPTAFVVLLPFIVSLAWPVKAAAQQEAPADTVAADSLPDVPRGAFPDPRVDPRLTLLGDTLGPADSLKPRFSDLPEFYPDSIIDPYGVETAAAVPVWVLEGEALMGRGAFSLLDVIESEFPVWAIDLGGSGLSAYLGSSAGAFSGIEVFVDGVPVGDPLTVAWDLRQIPLEAIARVAWYPGSQAAVWGGKATGGVLAITTRRSLAPTSRSLLAFTVGSFDTETFSGHFARPITWRGDLFIGANFDATDGFLGTGDFTRNQTVIKAGWRPGLRHRLEIARFGDGFSGTETRLNLAGRQDHDRTTWHLSYMGSWGPLETRTHLYRSRLDLGENFDFREEVGLLGEGERSGIRGEVGFVRGPVRARAFAVGEEEEVTSDHPAFLGTDGTNLLDPPEGVEGLENPRQSLEVGGSAELDLGSERLGAHVTVRRHDHGSAAEDGTSWQTSAMGRPVPRLLLRIAAGSSRRPAHLVEQAVLLRLAADGIDVHPGRPAEPRALETWRDVRGEATWSGDDWRVSARAWVASADGAFIWLSPSAWLAFDPAAAGVRLSEDGFNTFDVLDLSTTGIEGEVVLSLPWDLRGRVVARRVAVEDDRSGERLPYVPRTQALGQLRYARRLFPSRDLLLEARLTGRYTDDRPALDGQTLASHLVTDLLVQGTIINFTIFVSLKNLGNVLYLAEDGLGLSGREGYFGVNWRFRN